MALHRNIGITGKQSRKQLTEAPLRGALRSVEPQHDVKSRSVPFAWEMRQALTLGKIRENGSSDPLMLPAYQHDPGELAHLVEHRRFVADTVFGDRRDMEPLAERQDRFIGPLADRPVGGRRLRRIRRVDDVGLGEIRPESSGSEKHHPCARSLPPANDERVLVRRTLRCNARPRPGSSSSGFSACRISMIVNVDMMISPEEEFIRFYCVRDRLVVLPLNRRECHKGSNRWRL
jgi:hypothetical protein